MAIALGVKAVEAGLLGSSAKPLEAVANNTRQIRMGEIRLLTLFQGTFYFPEKGIKLILVDSVTCEELEARRDGLVSMLRSELPPDEKRFIVSVKEGHPRQDLLPLEGIEKLPAVKWKLLNIGKMDPSRHRHAVHKSRDYLGV